MERIKDIFSCSSFLGTIIFNFLIFSIDNAGCEVVVTKNGDTVDYFKDFAHYCLAESPEDIYNTIKNAIRNKSRLLPLKYFKFRNTNKYFTKIENKNKKFEKLQSIHETIY